MVINSAKYIGYYDFSDHSSDFRMADEFSSPDLTLSHGIIFSFNSFSDINGYFIGAATSYNGSPFT